MDKQKKILVIAPSWVGDLVMSQALLRLIKEKNPDCIIDVLASEALHPLIRMMPEVDDCIVSSLKHGDLKITERFKLGKDLRQNLYTHAYVLPNSFKSALIPFWAKISHRIGWKGEERFFILNDVRFFQKRILLMVDRYLALGKENKDNNEKLPGSNFWPKLKVSQEQIDLTLKKLQITLSGKPILAFCPGAEYGSSKRWPTNYFAEIARIKKEAGWDIWIFGGPKDQEIAKEIEELSNGACLDLTAKTDLGEVADLLSLATAVVTNDTGLMHVAAAVDRPIVAIYGSSSSGHTPPLAKDHLKIISLNLSCAPCFKRECPLEHHKCMVDLKPEMVLDAITEVAD